MMVSGNTQKQKNQVKLSDKEFSIIKQSLSQIVAYKKGQIDSKELKNSIDEIANTTELESILEHLPLEENIENQ